MTHFTLTPPPSLTNTTLITSTAATTTPSLLLTTPTTRTNHNPTSSTSTPTSTPLSPDAAAAEWAFPQPVVAVSSAVTVAVTLTGLTLNLLLVVTVRGSPSLRTPPNAHLLNLCLNSAVLGLSGLLLATPSLHLHGNPVPHRASAVLSGVHLALNQHCLLQYWGSFASIGYYRFKTIHHPTLSLRVRKLLVSRAITATWVVSLLLAVPFSLTSAQDSAYLPSTLDPFRCSFYLHLPPAPSAEDRGEGAGLGRGGQLDVNLNQGSEQVVVTCLVLIVLVLGLLMVLASYYSISRTLRFSGRARRTRVAPWPRPSLPSITSLVSSPVPLTPPPLPLHLPPLTCSAACSPVGGEDVSRQRMGSERRSCRAGGEKRVLCLSGSGAVGGSEQTWVVHYHKSEHSDFIEDLITLEKSASTLQRSRSATGRRKLYASQHPTLTATLSTGSTASGSRASSGRCPDFSDISLGADIARLQQLQCQTALKKQVVRRERSSLSHASRNSLAMLTLYLCCSLPLIVCQVPGSLGRLEPGSRVTVLLACRLLFLLNSPVYPLWYLLFSVRVKVCLARMCDMFMLRFQYRHQ